MKLANKKIVMRSINHKNKIKYKMINKIKKIQKIQKIIKFQAKMKLI